MIRSRTASHFKFEIPGTELSCTFVWSSLQYSVNAIFKSCFENDVISSDVRGFLVARVVEVEADDDIVV